MRLGIAGFVLQIFTDASAAPALSPADAQRVTKQGYAAPTLVFDGAVKIVSAKKAGKSRLVVVTSKAVVDAGATEAGTLKVAPPSGHGVSIVPGLTMLEVSYETPRANQGSHTGGTIWLVRADGSIACKVSGSSYDNAGSACGSSGSTVATPKLGSDGGKTVLDVKYRMSGNWSELDKSTGQCRHRSPVRHAKVERWIVPPRGTCKAGTAPNNGATDLNDGF